MKPCPFCGQTNAHVVELHEDCTNEVAVVCLCGARGLAQPWQGDYENESREYANREAAGIKAVEFWNTRTP